MFSFEPTLENCHCWRYRNSGFRIQLLPEKAKEFPPDVSSGRGRLVKEPLAFIRRDPPARLARLDLAKHLVPEKA